MESVQYQSKVSIRFYACVMILLIFSIIPTLGYSQFSLVTSSLPNVNMSDTAWGDYNNDGDLDILMIGNVYVWCWDVYKSRFPSRASDLKGALKGDYRMVKADCWFDAQIFCPVSQRVTSNNKLFNFNNDVGFSIVRNSSYHINNADI